MNKPIKTFNKGFFSSHPRFRETSGVASSLKRLDFRYLHIIERNKLLLQGKRILDIACHDARFSFAALKGAGAAHVTGIEARSSLVTKGVENLKHYGIHETQFDIICGDVYEKIAEIENRSIDTAMVLGFLYHTARQYELVSSLSQLGVDNIIVDSNVLPRAKRPIIVLEWEETQGDAKIWDAKRPKVLSSTPSALALQMILEEFGYSVEIQTPLIKIPRAAQQYKTGKRVTMVGKR